MRLHYAPGSCSLGIHVILAEIGQPFELAKVDLQAGEQYAPAFKAVNPKSKVPTLVRDDGSVLTEFPAIALWLARTYPAAELLPTDVEGEARALEIMDHVVGTIHGQGFARLFRPSNFAPDEASHPKVLDRGAELASKGLAILAERLDGRAYALGERFSVADAAMYYVERWANGRKLLPDGLRAHHDRVAARPAVGRVLAAEGLS